jgi:hypothetical protein
VQHGAAIFATTLSDGATAIEKCDPYREGYTDCATYLAGARQGGDAHLAGARARGGVARGRGGHGDCTSPMTGPQKRGTWNGSSVGVRTGQHGVGGTVPPLERRETWRLCRAIQMDTWRFLTCGAGSWKFQKCHQAGTGLGRWALPPVGHLAGEQAVVLVRGLGTISLVERHEAVPSRSRDRATSLGSQVGGARSGPCPCPLAGLSHPTVHFQTWSRAWG